MDSNQEKAPSILIVDDAPTNIEILVDTLEEDYHLVVAINGELALKQAKKHLPQLILLDIMMPGIDGFEVIRRLRKSPETKNIAVIFITALNETDDKIKGFELGAVDYITKPFIHAEVKSRVKTHLALVDYRERLEEKVKERTQALQEAHKKLQKMEGLLASIQTATMLNERIDQHLRLIIEYTRNSELADKTTAEVKSISRLITEILDKVSHSYDSYVEEETIEPNYSSTKEF